jgi:hypothetical protein
MSPGDRARAFAARMFDADTMARLVDPTTADLQREFACAQKGGRGWTRCRVVFAGYAALLKVITIALCRHTFDTRRWTPQERRDVWRVALWSTGAAAFMTALLVSPAVHATWSISTAAEAAIPLGMAVGVVTVGGKTISHRTAAAVLAMAFVMSLAALINTGALRPLEYRAFHEKLPGRSERPNRTTPIDADMSLWQLRREIKASSASTVHEPALYRMKVITYQAEWMSIAMPFVLTLPVLSIALHRRLSRWACVLALVSAQGLYLAFMILSRSPRIPDQWMTTAIWLPQVSMVAVSLLTLRVTRQSRPEA